MSKELLKEAAEAIELLREWIAAVPKDVELPAMPGVDGDWLDTLQHQLQEAAKDPTDWYEKIVGMEVSMDTSTGEDDIDNRIYGTVYEVMVSNNGYPDVLLAIEYERNFKDTPSPQKQWIGLTFDELWKTSYEFKQCEGFRDGACWAQEELRKRNQG
jgi:hypothetical protein